MTTTHTGLILVGAGLATRMNGIDKVWSLLAGHPLLWHSWHMLAPGVEQSVLVVRPDCVDVARALVGDQLNTTVVCGGSERQSSVAAGLAALSSVELVAVHDAARPLVPRELLDTGIELARRYGAATPVIPLDDTVKRLGPDGSILETLDRDYLRGAQTPQVFQEELLRQAHARARETAVHATDDADLVHRVLHADVATYPGSRRNFKVTTGFDLDVARLLLEHEVLQ